MDKQKIVYPETREEKKANKLKLDKEIAEMEETLPFYRGQIDGEDIELTNKEWKKLGSLKFVYTDDGSECFESDKTCLMQLLEMGKIKPIKTDNLSA